MTEPPPRVFVDGMNVIGSRPDGWWRNRDGAVRALLQRLQSLRRERGDDLTLVLDGRPLDDVPEGVHDGVRVLYARRRGRDAADDRLVEEIANAARRPAVRVVTSDRDLTRRARELGAEVVGASTLLRRLDTLGD